MTEDLTLAILSEIAAPGSGHIFSRREAARSAIAIIEAANARIAQFEAARIAYASEFPPNADGEPDVGNIHANIRAMKTDAATWRNLLALLIREIPQRYRRADDPNAPGHAHLRPGIWDDDNGALSGTQCAWCAVWNEARAAIAASEPKKD